MTTDKRPSANDVLDHLLRDGLRLSDARLTVRCEACNARAGVVVDTSHGPLWVGLLGNRNRSKVRAGVVGWGQTYLPLWVDPPRPFYIGECRCPRNSVDGGAVRRAVQAGTRTVKVPPQA